VIEEPTRQDGCVEDQKEEQCNNLVRNGLVEKEEHLISIR
jgi:hypothetical protein